MKSPILMELERAEWAFGLNNPAHGTERPVLTLVARRSPAPTLAAVDDRVLAFQQMPDGGPSKQVYHSGTGSLHTRHARLAAATEPPIDTQQSAYQ
ncbi:MAG: hypothetical protein R3C20_23075 [Planctomycetaceae bacterium]